MQAKSYQEVILILLVSIVKARNTSYVVMPGLPHESYKMLGDFNIGVLVSVHNYSRENFCADTVRNLGVLQRIEAIRYAIEEINNSTTLLPDHKLGFIMFDDCYKDITALAQSLHFIEQAGEGECLAETDVPGYCYNDTISTYEVVGIIGSESSTTTVQIANLFSSFEMPQISYLATGSSLMDNYSYPYFRRTVPADTLQAKVMVDLLIHFNWSYVSVVHMEGEYGTKGYQKLYMEGQAKGICFAEVLEVSNDFQLSNYQIAVFQLLQANKAKVIIVIAPLEQARQLLAAAHRLSVDGRITWISSDAWGRHLNEVSGYEEAAYGMISVSISSSTVKRFDKHFQTLRADTITNNPWMSHFYESYHHCTTAQNSTEMPSCDPTLRISNHRLYVADRIVSLVFDSVYAFAYALHEAVESPVCAYLNMTNAIKCAQKQLKYQLTTNFTFVGETGNITFDDTGDVPRNYIVRNLQNSSTGFKFVHIATWKHETQNLTFSGNSMQWSQGEQPASFCSSECGVGEQKILQEKRCCWVCEPCADDQYTRKWQGSHLRCYSCENGTWPDPETRSKCLPIEPRYMKWNDPLGILLSALTTTGLSVCILTAVVFALNKNDPLIKASSRELSYFMLTGVFINYVAVFCFLIKPDDFVCFIRFMGISICFTLLYAPLVTKTIRIYRIFKAGSRMNRRPTCVSSMSQIGIAVNVLLFHICIIVGWAVMHRPTTIEYQSDRHIVELICEFPLGPLITSLTYNGALVLASVYFAFKTRKLPGNYNESKFISFCVYSTVVIWCAFVPAYFAVGKAFFEVMFLSIVVLSNATLILSCMFLPKVFALYFVDENDLQVSPQFMKQNGTRRLFEEVSASTNSDITKGQERIQEKAPTDSGHPHGQKRSIVGPALIRNSVAPARKVTTASTVTEEDISHLIHVTPAPRAHPLPSDRWF